MAFFKFRKGGDEQPAPTPQPESVEAMRKRARHRLMGAAVLVVAGVIGFPMLFDSQPRPISVDIPIDIPDKNKAKPLAVPGAVPATVAPVAIAPEPVPPVSAPAPAAVEVKESAAAPKSEEKVAVALAKPALEATKTVALPEVKSEAKPEAKSETKIEPKATGSAKAKALLEGKEDKPAAVTEGRFVVQVGAFADATRAKDARAKLEHAGLKTYTQVVDTKDGQRTRVRVGPFTDKADAEKTAKKIKALELPAAVLTL